MANPAAASSPVWEYGMPSSNTLARHYSLAHAKALCNDETTRRLGAPSKPKKGSFMVLDFFSTHVAASAANMMSHAGLNGVTHFKTDQLQDACGYLAAAWACDLRARGVGYPFFTMEDASNYNTPMFMREQNVKLNHESRGERAEWLEVNDIMKLMTMDNPDGHGASPSWLMGVMPINHWSDAFHRTLHTPSEWDVVHIAIVNTEAASALTEYASGNHWITIAWMVYGDRVPVIPPPADRPNTEPVIDDTDWQQEL